MYSIPSVLNDVSRQFFEYVGETNREKLHNRRNGYAFQNPMIDPSGTRDPFWYHIEKFYGASDHQVHLDWQPQGGGPGGVGGGGAQVGAAPPALGGYYAMEARNFANGERSLLDVRNALAAEFGPVPLDDVTRFFRDLEKTGAYTIVQR